MSSPVLRIENLTVSADATGASVLAGVSLEVPQGALVAVVGESGSGKSTLINAILGLLPAGLSHSSGRILLFGNGTGGCNGMVDMKTIAPQELRRVLGRRIGYVPQDSFGGLDPLQSVESSLREAVRCHELMEESAVRQVIGRSTRGAGLGEGFLRRDAWKLPDELSGGQRQRVLVAQARVFDPDIVLYDEPTTALDPGTRQRVIRSIRASLAGNKSAMLVTHDIAASASVSDFIAIMYLGRIVEWGDSRQVLNDPLHPYTKDLIACIPSWTSDSPPEPIPGEAPMVPESLVGCCYQSRCRSVIPLCRMVEPCVQPRGEDRSVACHVAE